MQLYSVSTNEYDADIEMLLKRRMTRHGLEIAPMIFEKRDRYGTCVNIGLNGDEELERFSAALSELLILDIRYYEIADLAAALPCSAIEKRAILPVALALTEDEGASSEKAADMLRFLGESKRLNLEGYIRFRLRDIRESWRVAVSAAAEEILLGEECAELTRLLGAFPPDGEEEQPCIRVILNPDGSCTLTDGDESGEDSPFRIDCAPGSTGGVIGMIFGMKPKKVLLCDLSFGRCAELRTRIEMLYGENGEDN